ncbi:uncharacterized protein MEPE_05995 [Melanopsichium pennsylvanicum]|uniref:GATOR1 complex protein NPRL3 C-terminal HTH domain-containing protein n=2 Tax=Melanopsichium pennsylvanicum TaxID=63383 RepID=A0AAJ5C7U0_9BASI|nr:conserved hypothetical protein [Melanopsichium pennsylvanicum 4]SNX87285.1 uncharacterized protein MEPE_05995 [Melanopsichium pennsylvanicum]
MSEPLLGVILATSSSRGSHIVFRWPNNPKLFKRYSKVKYYTDAPSSQRAHRHLDDELDPVRQKAKWDRHDEDDDDQNDIHSDGAGQSDTPSSSDLEDSDGTMADDDEVRSIRNGAETTTSHSRSNAGNAAASTSRSKSKPRKPIMSSLEESSQSVRSNDRQNKDKDSGDNHNRTAPDSDAGTSKELSPEEKARREERAAMAYKTYLGYDIEILASILNPRPELAHQKFELIVDDLAFLGHPVSASKGGVWGEQDNFQDDDEEDGNDETGKPGQTQQRGRSGLRKEIRPYDLPDGEDSTKDTAGSSTKNDRLDSNLVAKSRSMSRTRSNQGPTDSYSSRSFAPLTQFHLVLVLDRPDPSTIMSGMDLSSWLQLFYDNIVFKMTAALFAEQSKAHYVGRETEKLLALRERCMDDGQAYAAYAAQCLGISSLARCIRDLHKSISTSSDAFLTINDRIEVHLQLPPILQDPTNLPKTVDIETELDPNDPIFLSGGGFAGLGKEGADEDGGGGTYDRLLDLAPHQLSFEEWCRTTGPYLLPWKTLLLLHDQADEPALRGRGGSPGNSSPKLASPSGTQDAHGFEQLARNFTSLFRPNLYHSLNFSEVADMLGWDLYEDVYPMIRHLIYYRQAHVIDVPRPGHVYVISPLFDFARLGPLSRIWAQTFPDLAPLPVLLSQLSSSCKALSALFPARHQRELALDVLLWLLRREVVVKMHVRLRLIATEAIKRRTAERRIERHERHRKRRGKKQERAAKVEARRMKKSQLEEKEKRKAAELVRKKEKEARKMGAVEERGRSRDRDRSRSVDARRKVEEGMVEGEKGSDDLAMDDATNEREVHTLEQTVPRPLILTHPDSVAEAAAAAAAIAGRSGAEELRCTSRERGSHQHDLDHRDHHHRHQHHHHRHRDKSTSDSTISTEPSTAATGRKPIAIAAKGQPFSELKFERRPVLRSRSPSTAVLPTPTSTAALSVSFSTLYSNNRGELGELGRRARADTATSSTSSSSRPTRPEALSMTPNTSQQSRPTTPIVIGRNLPSHIRDRSAGGGSNVSSSVEGGSVPRRARRAVSSAGAGAIGGWKKGARSRSPSRARMRVKGFGVGAQVEVDEDKSAEDEDDRGSIGDDEKEKKDNEAENNASGKVTSKLNALGLKGEDAGKVGMSRRRISAASERPDLPAPSESGSDVEGKEGHSSGCDCCRYTQSDPSSSACSSSSSGEMTTSDMSLSSELDSDSEDDPLSSSLVRPPRKRQSKYSYESDPKSRPNLYRSITMCTATTTDETEDFIESLIIEPSRASRRENEYIATMVEGKDAATVKNFFRLLPYLNGKHTIDEIEYRVRMRRRDIRRLLAVFREYVVTFMHP